MHDMSKSDEIVMSAVFFMITTAFAYLLTLPK